MSIGENRANHYFALPESLRGLTLAAEDPLSPPDLLRGIFYDYGAVDAMYHPPLYLTTLASNPSLPSDIFDELFVMLKKKEEFCYAESAPMSSDLLADFFLNPLTTFEQVLDIVVSSTTMRDFAGLKELESSKSVVEIFDRLLPSVRVEYNAFLSKLLCSPLINEEDFRARFRIEEEDSKLALWAVSVHSQFTPSASDYGSALDFMRSQVSSSISRGMNIIANKNASPEFLAEALKYATRDNNIEYCVYHNLNCPIELSARWHFDHIEDYRWSPSYMIELESTANEYINRAMGKVPLEDLPLTWKLRMIAG